MKLLQGASLHWHPAEWEKIPWCIALVIFSSNRTCYHPRSQHRWRVCAPFRTDLNTSWKLTQSLLWCMNINVTSDRVQQEMGKYQFIMSSGLGRTISLWTHLTFSPSYEQVCEFSTELSFRRRGYRRQTVQSAHNNTTDGHFKMTTLNKSSPLRTLNGK